MVDPRRARRRGFSCPDDTSDRDPYCELLPRVTPDYDNVKYKTFTRPPDLAVRQIRLDQFNPVGTGSFPAMILVHGGRWWSGCKEAISGLAETLSRDPDLLVPQEFFVFAIDYRLSCDPDDQNVDGTPIEPLCGWSYRTIDPATSSRGAAIHDVQDAVWWVRTKWPTTVYFDSRWDGRVFVAGASAGGNLALTAVALSTQAASNRPLAVAAWSGPSEQQIMSNGQYGCSAPNSGSPGLCWRRTNQYLGCVIAPAVDPACVLPINYYAESSAITFGNYDSNDPPAFFANGGGGGAPPELIALLEAIDFQLRLEQDLGFDPLTEAVLCQVDADKHATGYLNLPYHCADRPGTESVLQTTVNFLDAILG